MYETFENAFQILMLLISAGISLSLALKTHKKSWILLSLFYGCWVLGDIYWQLCLMLFGDIPQLSLVSDLSWYASFIFLYILLRYVEPKSGFSKHFLPWLGPIFTFAMALFFIFQNGVWQVGSNLVCALFMGILLYASISRIMDHKKEGTRGYLCVMVLFLILMEYGMWISTSFVLEDNLMHPYYWFDILLSISFVLYIPALKKEGVSA
ncbi:MAG: hypothetical protein J6Q41_07550 [Firmicutes bacterium]|nr:hypothetical protein [Bacillota bacterium]